MKSSISTYFETRIQINTIFGHIFCDSDTISRHCQSQKPPLFKVPTSSPTVIPGTASSQSLCSSAVKRVSVGVMLFSALSHKPLIYTQLLDEFLRATSQEINERHYTSYSCCAAVSWHLT